MISICIDAHWTNLFVSVDGLLQIAFQMIRAPLFCGSYMGECKWLVETIGAPRENEITGEIIGAAIEVHREMGPGLLESAYEQCLCRELSLRGLSFESQIKLPVEYKGVRLDCGYKLDVIVEDLVVVELKTVQELLPIHDAQLLTYLKISGYQLGLLINFNVPVLKDGLKRIVNNYRPSSASPRLRGSP